MTSLLVFSLVIRVNLPWLLELPGREFMTVDFLLEDLSLGRESISAFAIFQVPKAWNNQCVKAAYFRMACFEFLHNLLGTCGHCDNEVPQLDL